MPADASSSTHFSRASGKEPTRLPKRESTVFRVCMLMIALVTGIDLGQFRAEDFTAFLEGSGATPKRNAVAVGGGRWRYQWKRLGKARKKAGGKRLLEICSAAIGKFCSGTAGRIEFDLVERPSCIQPTQTQRMQLVIVHKTAGEVFRSNYVTIGEG